MVYNADSGSDWDSPFFGQILALDFQGQHRCLVRKVSYLVVTVHLVCRALLWMDQDDRWSGQPAWPGWLGWDMTNAQRRKKKLWLQEIWLWSPDGESGKAGWSAAGQYDRSRSVPTLVASSSSSSSPSTSNQSSDQDYRHADQDSYQPSVIDVCDPAPIVALCRQVSQSCPRGFTWRGVGWGEINLYTFNFFWTEWKVDW